jgi:hypothetical protein
MKYKESTNGECSNAARDEPSESARRWAIVRRHLLATISALNIARRLRKKTPVEPPRKGILRNSVQRLREKNADGTAIVHINPTVTTRHDGADEACSSSKKDTFDIFANLNLDLPLPDIPGTSTNTI